MTLTLPDPLTRLYAGSPKLIAIGLAPEAAQDLLPDPRCDALHVAPADTGDGLVATAGGAEVAITAPPAGICVLAHDAAAREAAETLLDLWRRAGLEPPERVEATEPETARRAVAAAFAAAALSAHAEACAEAVELDRQIAALRDQVEDARNRWSDCAHALQAATRGLPVLGYNTRDFAPQDHMLTTGQTVTQALPYASRHCRAFALHLARPAAGSGRLDCRVIAQEDDVTLARWEGVPADAPGWIAFELPDDIPWRYRNISLALEWEGAGEGPAISLAAGAGMARYLLHVDGRPSPGRRAAMRVWTGQSEARLESALKPGMRAPEAFGQMLDQGVLKSHVPLVERSLGQWPWVQLGERGIMVHPTLAPGPSVVRVTLESQFAVQGVRMMLHSPNADAPPIEFMAAVFDGGHPLALDNDAADPLPRDAAVAIADWQEIAPGSGMPLVLDFAARETPLALVLATRVRGERVGKAHGWFEDIRMICSS